MKDILITGGCGFVGINLINYLRHHRPATTIIVLDNLSLGKKEYIDNFEVEFIAGDIRDDKLMKKLAARVDTIVHLAADTRVLDSIDNPDFNFDVNVIGTYNLLRAARLEGVEHFVMASTGGAIIGDVSPPVHEGMVPKPLSPYGASKLCAEAYLSAFSGSYDMKTVALRFSNIYGPHSYHKGSVVAAFYKNIINGQPLVVYGDGSQTRDYVFSEDLCAAITNACELSNGGEAIQLGSGVGISINTLIEQMKQVVGQEYPFDVQYEDFRKGEVKFNFADISKAKKVLNYNPQVTLLDGLHKTWQWFRKAQIQGRK